MRQEENRRRESHGRSFRVCFASVSFDTHSALTRLGVDGDPQWLRRADDPAGHGHKQREERRVCVRSGERNRKSTFRRIPHHSAGYRFMFFSFFFSICPPLAYQQPVACQQQAFWSESGVLVGLSRHSDSELRCRPCSRRLLCSLSSFWLFHLS